MAAPHSSHMLSLRMLLIHGHSAAALPLPLQAAAAGSLRASSMLQEAGATPLTARLGAAALPLMGTSL